MVRIVLAVVLLMQLLAQGVGLVYAASELACDDDTSEESGEDDCTPGCKISEPEPGEIMHVPKPGLTA